MKKIGTKILSLFLVVLMVFSVMPMAKVEAEAVVKPTVYSQLQDTAKYNYPGGSGSTYKSSGCGVYAIVNAIKYLTDEKIDPHKLGDFAIKNGARINGGTIGQVLCTKAAKSEQFGGEYGFTLSEKYVFGSSKRTMTCKIGNKITSKNYPSESEWKTLHSKLVSHLEAGDVAVVLVLGHYMAIVDYDSTTGKFLMLDSAAYTKKRLTQNSGKYQWVTADQLNYNKAPKANASYNNQGPYIHLRQEVMFFRKTNISYTVSLSNVSNITNSSATINVGLDKTATVKKWTYFLSTNKSEVSNVNGAVGSTHKTTSTMDCVRILDYTSNPQTQKTASFTINKYQGKALSPNTTYYYKATVCINGKWYESSVGSFKTAANKPGVTTVRISSSTQKVGRGDQVTVIWDAASNAESYNVSVKNSSGTLVQHKSGVKGLTCVLNGLSSAGTYTVTVDAVNGAGSTTGESTTFVVMPDVTVKFYDTISQKVIRTQSVAWGHNATAPANPTQPGHTFSKWDIDYTKVTSDITVNTVYDKNTYTVKFVDNFTNAVLKTQYVKYGDAATAPSVTAPEGFSLTGWDKSFNSVKSDLTVYTVFKWTDTDNTATATINSVVRNTTKLGYDVSVTVKNQISEISSGRVVVVLKSNNGVVLTSTESSAFAIDSLGSKTLSVTVLYPELAPKVEVYVVNGFEGLGQISKTATANIDNSTSSDWSEWITYTGTCPMTTGNGVTVETRTLTSTTPAKYYYRYQIKETTTSYSTSLSGYTQNGYSLVKSSSGTIDYVSSWPSGFNTSNSLYTTYNKTPKSASETSTQKVVIDSTSTLGYIYWHWCRGDSVGAINRATNWSKTSTFDTFHAFYSTTKKSYSSSANAYQWKNTSACNDTYWWNGHTTKVDNLVTVKRQNYTIYNKLYNYYKYSAYTSWIEMSSSTAPISNGQSAGTNKTYQNVQVNTVPSSTTYTYQYRYMTTTNPTIVEPTTTAERVYNLTGNVDSTFAGKAATVWVYKFDQASDYTTEYVGTTTVGTDGSIAINNAVLREAPTVDSGDYTIVAAVAGQTKAIEIGKIEAPKPTHTVKFYDFDRTTVISTQTVTDGENAELPSEELLTVPEGSRFTNWSESVVSVRADLEVFPQSETKSFVVAFVNWEIQTVSLKEFNYGAELIADGVPEGKDGYITEWVIQVDDEYLTIDEYTAAGKFVDGNMVVETRSTPMQHNVTIVDVDKNTIIDANKLATEGTDSFEIADEYVVVNGNHIDFSNVQESIEENPEYIFLGWINANTGEYIEETTITEDTVLYPEYIFAETTAEPYASVLTGEYTEAQTVELLCETEKATIWYTVDGTDPTSSDTTVEYTTPITIDESCVLRFYATSVGKNDSQQSYEMYAINVSDSTKFHIVKIYNNCFIESDEPDVAVGLVKEGSLLPDSLFNEYDGYVFDALYYDENFTEQFYYEFESITESLELYANYSLEKYTVVFEDYDGTVIDTQTVEHYGSATLPESPSREGYVFIGWSDSADYITENITITAQYLAEDEYATVSLNRTRTLNLAKGTTFTYLSATVTPEIHSDYERVWSTSNPSVVTVDENGIITAISVGQAIVTVTLPYTNSSASIAVNVVHNPDIEIVIKEDSVMGFDSWGYIRGVTTKENTVSQVEEDFENEGLLFYDLNKSAISGTKLIGTGSCVKLTDGENVLDEAMFILTGDLNGDGVCDVLDASTAQLAATGKITLEDHFNIALDSNADGEINTVDYQTVINQVLSE